MARALLVREAGQLDAGHEAAVADLADLPQRRDVLCEHRAEQVDLRGERVQDAV